MLWSTNITLCILYHLFVLYCYPAIYTQQEAFTCTNTERDIPESTCFSCSKNLIHTCIIKGVDICINVWEICRNKFGFIIAVSLFSLLISSKTVAVSKLLRYLSVISSLTVLQSSERSVSSKRFIISTNARCFSKLKNIPKIRTICS